MVTAAQQSPFSGKQRPCLLLVCSGSGKRDGTNIYHPVACILFLYPSSLLAGQLWVDCTVKTSTTASWMKASQDCSHFSGLRIYKDIAMKGQRATRGRKRETPGQGVRLGLLSLATLSTLVHTVGQRPCRANPACPRTSLNYHKMEHFIISSSGNMSADGKNKVKWYLNKMQRRGEMTEVEKII